MKKRTILLLLSVSVLLLLLTQTVSAMSSDNYALEWYTPLTTGGGKSSSTNYTIDFSIGQSAIGSSSSTNYRVGLGYWGALIEILRTWYINLPLIQR